MFQKVNQNIELRDFHDPERSEYLVTKGVVVERFDEEIHDSARDVVGKWEVLATYDNFFNLGHS